MAYCACVIAIFCMGQIPGSIDAAISKITTAFHLSSTTGLYVTTIAALASVVFSMLVGMIAGKKLGYRKLIYFCAIVEMLGALLPFFADNFILILVLRGLFGIGFGTNCLLQFIGGVILLIFAIVFGIKNPFPGISPDTKETAKAY